MEQLISKKYAVLVDGDNVAAKYMDAVIKELSTYGVLTVKRVYGNFRNDKLKQWEAASLQYSIIPIQQFENTSGKNSTDMCMAIDAMDILQANEVDGFCIISSDSDFTRLAARLRESGKEVIGIGNKQTVEAFRAACSTFKALEYLGEEFDDLEELEDKSEDNTEEAKEEKPSGLKALENEIYELLEDEENSMYASKLKETLVRRNPSFDNRDYGFSKFSTFLNSFERIELSNQGREVSLKGPSNQAIFDKVDLYASKGKYTTAQLNIKIMKEFPDFKLKNLGYTTWKSFINNNGYKIDDKKHVVKK